MTKRIPIGTVIGELTILDGPISTNQGYTRYTCQCSCGSVRTYISTKIRTGKVKSCGHLSFTPEANAKKGRITHGYSRRTGRSREYNIWAGIKQRCCNPNNPAFENYGGRGITICDRWNTFETFFSDMGPAPPKTSIDRINNDKGYAPENCRWASSRLQRINQRRTNMTNGRRFTLERIEDVSGVSGMGRVAEGIEFHDKQVAISWFGTYHSTEIHPSIQQVEAIHGHQGKTIVVWLD